MKRKDKSVGSSSPPPKEQVSAEKRTILGEHIAFEGGIRGKENLVIEGSVKGEIELSGCHVTVGPKGRVEADIQASDVTISGRLTGNVTSQGKVSFTKDADFSGEVRAKRITVEDGAYIKAVIEMEREPQKKVMPPGKPTPESPGEVKKPTFTLGLKDGEGQ
jgi:cytoskeletal protein CcmA (bactofilin family)